jgi:hypothetical protein
MAVNLSSLSFNWIPMETCPRKLTGSKMNALWS